MTHENLRKVAIAALKKNPYDWQRREHGVGFQCSIVASELVSSAQDIPDAIGWCMGHSVMIECKASRSDFLADAKKPHRISGTGCGERRYFMTPVGLLTPLEIPGDWGLIEIDGKRAVEVVKAPRRELDVRGHASEKRMLLSLIRRVKLREFLIISPEQLEQVLEVEVPA